VIVGASQLGCTEVRALGLMERVRLIPPIDDVRLLYGAADIFVAPSTAEGMPLAVLEVLCSGVPVVASDIASHRYVADAMPGCRLAARDAVAFADAVEAELDSEPWERSTRLAGSRAYAQRELSVRAWADRLVSVYDEVLRGQRNRERTR
jgi:glycosyltransferase involved in cell wall biosynthesis